MTIVSIDRTIYLCMKHSYTTKELIEAYTPTKEERHRVETMTYSGNHVMPDGWSENE